MKKKTDCKVEFEIYHIIVIQESLEGQYYYISRPWEDADHMYLTWHHENGDVDMGNIALEVDEERWGKKKDIGVLLTF